MRTSPVHRCVEREIRVWAEKILPVFGLLNRLSVLEICESV